MWALVSIACSSSEPAERVWEMDDHATEPHAAFVAVRRGDLEAARRSGEGLARPDPAPGLPEAGQAPLDEVRARGRALGEASALPGAAQTVIDLTASCAACHLRLGVDGDREPSSLSADPLWYALVFESEERWRAGSALLPEASVVAAGRSWTSRRDVLARLLADGRLE